MYKLYAVSILVPPNWVLSKNVREKITFNLIGMGKAMKEKDVPAICKAEFTLPQLKLNQGLLDSDWIWKAVKEKGPSLDAPAIFWDVCQYHYTAPVLIYSKAELALP